jgi:hypothetical protein
VFRVPVKGQKCVFAPVTHPVRVSVFWLQIAKVFAWSEGKSGQK